MLAFQNTTVTKPQILEKLKAHAKADDFIKGTYWENGKGCAVGCTIESGDHAEYETRFGIPQMLARLEDRIFEGLPNGKAKKWPLRFMEAIKPGADLSTVGWEFQHRLQINNLKFAQEQKFPNDVIKAIQLVIDVLDLMTKGNKVDESAWSAAESAWSAARSAARSAESARSAARSAEWSARSAARSAESAELAELAARSAWSAWSAARSAARSAESAELAAESAELAARSAWSAARSAWSAESAESAWSAAESAAESAARSAESAARSAESAELAKEKCYEEMADLLIEIIEKH
jgi:hypothetical protein